MKELRQLSVRLLFAFILFGMCEWMNGEGLNE